MQEGGGITHENAQKFLDAGASHVIVTSYVFQDGQVNMGRLNELIKAVGKDRLVLDLSCRMRKNEYWVVTDRWQKFTEVQIKKETLEWLSGYCDEFLIHGVDVEGKRTGIETYLVTMLGEWSPISITYAGGGKSLSDLDYVKDLGNNRVDFTIASALDIFGGDISYRDVVEWQRKEESK